MFLGHLQYRPSQRSHNRQSGYMLIVVIFLVVGMTIAALAIGPAIAQQIKRDREQEMIHRGVEYARAIKKYYRKFGRYPATLEALEDTNHMRFLRKRYKDPLTKDGKWQLVRYGQVQFNAANRQGGTGFTGGTGLPNVPGVTGLLQGSQTSMQTGGLTSGGTGGTGTSSTTGSAGSTSSTASGSSGTTGGTTSDTTGGTSTSLGSSFGQSTTGGGNQLFGGGAIIGVASMSDKESLRIVDGKNHYKDWKFIYDPTFDRGLITGPYDPKKQMGLLPNQSQPGQPIGQPAGQQSGSQSNSGGNTFGQPIQNRMPPDQNAPSQNPQ